VCFFPPHLQPAAVRRARDHIVEGLSSIMLATKRRPLIRYQSSSEHARSVALDMWRLMYEQEVMGVPSSNATPFSFPPALTPTPSSTLTTHELVLSALRCNLLP
jgi:hypothetical protein